MAQAAATVVSTAPLSAGTLAIQRLLQTAYPELRSRALWTDLERIGPDLLLRLEDARPLVQGKLPHPAALIDARARVDSTGRILQYQALGTFVEGPKNLLLAEDLEAHPDWTQAQMRARLQQLAAQYGPDRAPDLTRALDATRWTAFLGSNFTAGAATFQWRDATATATAPRAGWVTDVSAAPTVGVTASYRVRFEPIGGRLVEIMAR
jgi:hypothetical protein